MVEDRADGRQFESSCGGLGKNQWRESQSRSYASVAQDYAFGDVGLFDS